MAKKKYDLAVKVGTYEKDGQTKGRYVNCGAVLEKEDGSKFLLIDPLFNFGAVKREEGRDMVIVSMFEPKEKQQGDNWDSKSTTEQVNQEE